VATKLKMWTVIGRRILITILMGLALTALAATPLESSLQVFSSSSLSSTNAPVINDISCDTMEHFTMHIHAHLDIFINGEGYSIPSNIGIIPNQCIYWLHTHDDTGIIHIESPENRTFTLGEFFDIWGENLNNNQIFDNMAGQGNNLTVFVNGKQASPGTDFRKIPVNAYDEIVSYMANHQTLFHQVTNSQRDYNLSDYQLQDSLLYLYQMKQMKAGRMKDTKTSSLLLHIYKY
jgi:hypothetical protein